MDQEGDPVVVESKDLLHLTQCKNSSIAMNTMLPVRLRETTQSSQSDILTLH